MLRLLRRLCGRTPALAPAAGGTIDQKLREAISRHQAGELDAATRLYRSILAEDPRHFDALHMLGVVASQRGDHQQAMDLIASALEGHAPSAAAFNNHGLAAMRLGRFDIAVESFGSAIRLRPDYVEALSNRGLALHELGRFREAVESFQGAVALNPDFVPAHYNLGRTLQEMGGFEEAVAAYGRAIALDSRSSDAHHNRALAQMRLGRTHDALADYDRAIAIKPDDAALHLNRGVALSSLKLGEEAMASYGRALALDPGNAKAWCNRGNLLLEARQPQKALDSYDRAIALDRGFAEAYVNRGNALKELGDLEAAISNYECALELKPRSAEARFNRAVALGELNLVEEAVEEYRRTRQVDPDYEFLLGNLLHAQLELCDWQGLEGEVEELAARILAGKRAATPFTTLAILDSPQVQRKAAELFVESRHPPRGSLAPPVARAEGERVRVGYYSPDFRDHSVAILAAGLIECHDRARFEVTGFAFGPPAENDPMRKRLSAAFERFLDVRELGDKDVAAMSRDLGIDIAVDLAGFTEHARTGIFALRAAPVQASYLGYLGTMGADYFDYLFADKTIIPEAHQDHYRERIAYLPTYQVNDSRRAVAERTFTRDELGLPPDGFAFCCLNTAYKISPSTFSSWMRILAAVPGSTLTLFARHEKARANLRREARSRGISPERIVFATALPREDYLARFRAWDLFLDTVPYNAGTVASDALWAGLPVVTLAGKSFASRVAASVLAAVGLPELVARSPDEYEAIAIGLATDPGRHAASRRKLEGNRLVEPLFDTALFTKRIEAAFSAMHARARAGLPPETFSVG